MGKKECKNRGNTKEQVENDANQKTIKSQKERSG